MQYNHREVIKCAIKITESYRAMHHAINSDYYTESLSIKISGIINAAAELKDTPIFSNLDYLYKECCRKAEVLSTEVFQHHTFPSSILTDKGALATVMGKILKTLASSNLEADKTETLARQCIEFRECLKSLEMATKQEYLKTYPFTTDKGLDFSEGVLVRSVDNLDYEKGYYCSDYPIISTSIFTNDRQNWYMKKHRKIMLVYRLRSPEDIVAMFLSDSNTYCLLGEPNSSEFYWEQLLIDDGLADSVFGTLYPDYRCAYHIDKLKEQELCEVVLKSEVKPSGILVGDVTVLGNSELCQSVGLFAGYYRLPVYLLSGGTVFELRCFNN